MEQENRTVKIVKLILANLEEIISILIVIVLLVIDKLFSVIIQPDVYYYTIFAILVTLTIGNIRNRYDYFYQDSKLLKSINLRLEQKIFEPISANNFFQKPPVYDEPFPNSGEILISGITLLETIGMFQKKLDDAITNGAHVRILLLDENNASNIEQLIERSWGKVDKDYYAKRINSTYTQIQVIAEKINKAGSVKGTLEVGKLPFVPSFGIVAIIPEDISKKIIHVKIYHHRTNNPKPSFSLSYCKDQDWYNFFIEQFNEEWNISKPAKIIG